MNAAGGISISKKKERTVSQERTVRSGYRIDKEAPCLHKGAAAQVREVTRFRVLELGGISQFRLLTRLLSPMNKRGYAFGACGACGVTYRYAN